MNIDLYSDRAKQAIQSAQSLALARRHQQLAPEHLLKVLLEEKDGLARALIQSAGGRPDAVDQQVDDLLAKIPKVEGGSGQLYMNPDAARVFAPAEADATMQGFGKRSDSMGARMGLLWNKMANYALVGAAGIAAVSVDLAYKYQDALDSMQRATKAGRS